MKIVLDVIALLFLTASGYSIGAVLGGWTRPVRIPNPMPGAVDTLAVGALWVSLVVIRLKLTGRWASFGLALAVAFVSGYILRRVQQRSPQDEGLFR